MVFYAIILMFCIESLKSESLLDDRWLIQLKGKLDETSARRSQLLAEFALNDDLEEEPAVVQQESRTSREKPILKPARNPIDELSLSTAIEMGIQHAQAKRFPQAVPYFLQALHRSPDMWNNHNNIAMVYVQTVENLKAMLHYRRAVELSPDNEQVSIQKHTGTAEQQLRRIYLQESGTFYGEPNSAAATFIGEDETL